MSKHSQKARKPRQDARRRDSQSQAERNPMIGVRVPRSLYTALQDAAKSDSRTLADWLRLNLPRLLLDRTAIVARLTSERNAAIAANYPSVCECGKAVMVDGGVDKVAFGMVCAERDELQARIQEPTEPAK